MFARLFGQGHRLLGDLLAYNAADVIADGGLPVAAEGCQLHGKVVCPVLGVLLKHQLHLIDLLRQQIDGLVHLLTLVGSVFGDGALRCDGVKLFVVLGVAFSLEVEVGVGGAAGQGTRTT